MVVLDRFRRGEPAGAVRGGVGVGRFRRGHLDRQVDHAVAVVGHVPAEAGARPDRAAQHETCPAGFEDVGGLVPAAGLRAAVGDEPHAERG